MMIRSANGGREVGEDPERWRLNDDLDLSPATSSSRQAAQS